MSTPNYEQQPAIDHKGGVLLKAGAGSGKTFVLVEHIIYLTQCWRQEWEETQSENFGDWVGKKFSTTVIMTFTKLAASEIGVRLAARFQSKIDEVAEIEQSWWSMALDQIDRLQVTTIDGFFYKLVRRGFFPNLPPDTSIIMSEPRRKKIFQLFDSWWEFHWEKLSPSIARDIAIHRSALVETLLLVFNDPSLRDAWVKFTPRQASPTNLAWMISELNTLEGWQDFLGMPLIDVPSAARAKGNKWVELADALNSRSKSINDWEDILSWTDFIGSEVGKTRLNLGAAKALVGDSFEKWKKFRDSVEKWGHSYQGYCNNFSDQILPWLETLKSIVSYVNDGLNPAEGLTYGDLEYHVLQGLHDSKINNRIQQEFNYFVIDEFQDTSRLQYEIMLRLTGNNSERFFCVGDVKQAIYGFRGGELRVFQDVEHREGIKTLPLSSNYRSLFKIIQFNNAFFDLIFPLGLGWEGADSHAVKMEPQVLPAASDKQGSVSIIHTQLPDLRLVDDTQCEKKSPKWKMSQLHHAEALAIGRVIEDSLTSRSEGRIAVLYKKLAPASSLMTLLMERGIGFTAQAKIPFKDDPVAGMLLVLIEDILTKKEHNWSQFMISGYLHLLGLLPGEDVATSCASFSKDVQLFGPLVAFDIFLSRLGVSSGIPQNLIEIREVLRLGVGDLERVMLRLRARGEESWSANFQFGPQSHRVILQTSHSSKGLEYDSVIVAGLATNGRSRSNTDWIGSLPGAVMWVEDISKRKRTATPQFLFEKTLRAQKEFAETKRLFYVACTRAKKSLMMVRLVGQEDQLVIDGNCWAKGLEKFLEHRNGELVENIEMKLFSEDFKRQDTNRPFFHSNQLGICRKTGLHHSPVYGITSELSVTGLNSLFECPRKFYFKQILKLHEDDSSVSEAWGGGGEVRAVSSSVRGSSIHLALAQAIRQNFVLPSAWINHKDHPHLEWVLKLLRDIADQGARLVCEETIKFPLFGLMMTGIPDLVVYGGQVEIWDYKTGHRNEVNELKYWQQLMIYAWSQWKNQLVPISSPIILRLCYVDDHEAPTKKVHFAEVRNDLFKLWARLSDLYKIDESHCPVCPYQGICPR